MRRVFMSLGRRFRSLTQRSRRVLLLAVAVVVLGVVATVSIVLHNQSDSDKHVTKTTEQQPSFADQLNGYVINDQYDKAIDLIEHQKDASSDQKQELLASIYSDKDDYAKAMAIYARLKDKGTLSVSGANDAARIAEAEGDKKQAIEYYTLARNIVLKNTNNPVREDDAAYYSGKIKELSK